MRYLVTYYHKRGTGISNESFTELIEARKFFEWWTMKNHDIVVTLFEKIGNEDYVHNLKYG